MSAQGKGRITRRWILKAGAGVALGGPLASPDLGQAVPPTPRPNIYERLGVKPVINATGTVTFLGGSLMPPEVAAAWVEA